MEGVVKRSYIAGGLILAFGLFLQIAPKPSFGKDKTEDWLEAKAPMRVGAFEMMRGKEDPGQTYKMAGIAYKELKPFGIVVRVYRSDRKMFDVALIVSNKKESFHDQRVCFTSQGWNIAADKEAFVESKARGRVPVSLLELVDQQQGKKSAVLFYKGPGGFYRNPRDLTLALFRSQLSAIVKMIFTWSSDDEFDSVFYRIIPQSDVSSEELLDWVGKYLDAASESSGGYF